MKQPLTEVCSPPEAGGLGLALTPFVVRNGAGRWRALESWSWAYLRQHVGMEVVPVFPGFDPSRPGPVTDGPCSKMTLADYIDRVVAGTAGELGYVSQIEILRTMPRLLMDFTIPAMIPSALLLEVNLWLAFAGKTTPLHFDFYHTALVQVLGCKKVTLAHPNHYDALDFFAVGSRSERRSRAPLGERDPEGVELFNVELRPGDLLFVPAFWAHETVATDNSVGVSFWWRAALASVLPCPGLSVAFFEEATRNDPGRLLRIFDLPHPTDLAAVLEAFVRSGRADQARLLVRGVLRELDRLLEQPAGAASTATVARLAELARTGLASPAWVDPS